MNHHSLTVKAGDRVSFRHRSGIHRVDRVLGRSLWYCAASGQTECTSTRSVVLLIKNGLNRH
jgi:hypothetical protein